MQLKEEEGEQTDRTTPDPNGHRSQRPCAQGRACATLDQAQAVVRRDKSRTRSYIIGGVTGTTAMAM